MSMLSLGEPVTLVLNPTRSENPFSSVDLRGIELEKIGSGVNTIVYLAKLGDTGKGFVVRRPVLDRRIGELWHELSHYRLLEEFIGEKYLPDALFIWDRTQPVDGRNGYCLTSYFPEFMTIDSLSDLEYFALKEQLIEVIEGMIKMMEKTGEVVDISGNKGRFFLNLMNFRRSENVVVIVDENGDQQVIILDFGRGHVLARIPILKGLIRTAFIFGLRRALKEIEEYCEP